MSRKLSNINRNTWFKYGMGIGLGLFPIDHYPVNLVGLIILFVFSSLYSYNVRFKKEDLGSKWIYIPMLVIFGVTLLRLALYRNVDEAFTVVFFFTAIILYLASRKLGEDIAKVLLPFFLIEVASIVIAGFINPGEIDSGIIGQYNRAVGLLAFTALLLRGKWQWLWVMLAFLAIILTGSLEGLLIIAVVGIIILARHDWGKRLWMPLVFGVVALLPLALSGKIAYLYQQPISYLNVDSLSSASLNGRCGVYTEAIRRISILGHGYTNSLFDGRTVHNVPLIIVDQLGIIVAVAWLIITLYCLVKTNWKYAWVFVIAAGVFDHYIWTGLAPYFWLLMGISTASKISNDYIFKNRGVILNE